MGRLLGEAVSGLLAISLLPAGAAPVGAATSVVRWSTATVLRWIDGDTVVTTRGTVRLVGVDTAGCGLVRRL